MRDARSEQDQENTPARCADRLDNDHDGHVDCDDPGCRALSEFCENTSSLCHDGLDNDLDGNIDCEDIGCLEAGACCCPCGYPLEFVAPGHWHATLTEAEDDLDPTTSGLQYDVVVRATEPQAGSEVCLYLDQLEIPLACVDPLQDDPIRYPSVTFGRGRHSLFAQVRWASHDCDPERIDIDVFTLPSCEISAPALSVDATRPTPRLQDGLVVETATDGGRAELFVNAVSAGLSYAVDGLVVHPEVLLAPGLSTVQSHCFNPGAIAGDTWSPVYYVELR